jgi:hypothetical protein
MTVVDRLSVSNVVRIDPDDAMELSLVKVKVLLLNCILRIPPITGVRHHLDQHGWMSTYTQTFGQTYNLTGWKSCHLKKKRYANASDYEETWNDSDSITAVIVREMRILTISKQHLHKSFYMKHKDSRQTQHRYSYKEAINEMC